MNKTTILMLGVSLSVAIAALVSADADFRRSGPHTKVYIDLTEGFYRALQESSSGNTRKLSTGMTDEYLQQIAVAGRYMVETNFEVLRQQERIIQLLEEIRDRSLKHP